MPSSISTSTTHTAYPDQQHYQQQDYYYLKCRRIVILLAISISACFGIWKLYESFSSNEEVGKSAILEHYLVAREKWTTALHSNRHNLLRR